VTIADRLLRSVVPTGKRDTAAVMEGVVMSLLGLEPAVTGSVQGPRWSRSIGVRLLVLLGIVGAVSAAANVMVSAADGSAVGTLLAGVAAAGLAVAAYRAAVRWVECRRAVEVSWPGAAAGLRRGVVAGGALFAAVIGLIAFCGGYRVTGWGSVAGAVAVLGVMTSVAVSEELLFRAVLFRIVEERAGTWAALVISGLLFGLLHLINPGATAFGAVAVTVEAGALLGAAYVATRTIWLPVGLHLGWNVAQAGIFGTTVSGTDVAPEGLLRGVLTGPAALTGGDFGPEASVVAVLVCAVPTVMLLRLARRRGHLVPAGRR
jgi:uncharacterized protein